MLAASVEPTAAPLSRNRADRYAARYVLWDESSLKRVRACGRFRQSNAEGVTVRVSESTAGRHAGFGGVQSCGSVWACPVCSAKIAEGRRVDVESGLRAWQSMGGTVALATFTMRHRAGQSLRSLWDALAYAWSKMTSGRGWLKDRQHVGGVDWIRFVEVTYGESGWHVHVHALLLLAADADAKTAAYLEGSMYGRWVNALERKGLSALRSVGSDVRMLEGDSASSALGEYLNKNVYDAHKASYEVARGDLKGARWHNRTPFAVLADVVAKGDAEDLDVWHEWERSSKGRRQMGWSRGLRDLLALGRELTDEELGAADDNGETEAVLEPVQWQAIVAERVQFEVLSAFERGRSEGAAYLIGMQPVVLAVEAARAAAAESMARGRRRYRRR